jgi:hypothetical protein
MEIPQDKVPCNLDEAIDLLMESLNGDSIKFISDKNSSPTQCHFNFGMALRNDWSLWDKNTILVKWFYKTYGVNHADDISGIILECLWNDVRQEKRRDVILSEECKAHWEEIKNQDKDYD